MSLKSLPTQEYFTQGHRLCSGCGAGTALRQIFTALDKPPIVVNATCCVEVATTPYPYTNWNVNWIHPAFECTAATAAGVEAGLKALQRKGRIPKTNNPIIALAGDGGTYDIGFQALSGALERGHNFTYICYSNEAYMNTGIQRSSATPKYGWTTTSASGKVVPGKIQFQKDIMKIVVAHEIPYAATGSPAYPMDLIKKVREAIAVEGPAFLLVLATCPRGWRTESELTIEIARQAVLTRYWPLYEVENGKYRITKNIVKKRPVEEYLKYQGKFRHLFRPKRQEELIQEIQNYVDRKWQELVDLEKMAQKNTD
ncbi:MAG: thiamine pyrophosphate-dependent enzyme [Candidatus Jordarchaeum sp.]|uniref:thiamine pyrophosphate-dependent enzyme n=1 Tax=Candidatus Jordarchaeum sp. TaxID=2823881 RepID=UPI0040491D83